MDAGVFSVLMEGGRPWGFTLQGGLEFHSPLRVGRVTPGGKAEKAGLIAGDYITSINNTEVKGLKHLNAKQLVVKSTTTLQLSCTKDPPVGVFSPPGNKPVPQFSFPSPRSPSPSSHPVPRPRSSSFTSPSSQPHPRTSSFTSPTPSHLTPSPSHSAVKSLSLKRPPPPAVVVAMTLAGGRGRSGTLPSGRPRPPVNYQGDIWNSSSGVSSSVSSAASSPPPPALTEGGPLKYSTPHTQPPAQTEGGPLQYSTPHTQHPAQTEQDPVQYSTPHTEPPAETEQDPVQYSAPHTQLEAANIDPSLDQTSDHVVTTNMIPADDNTETADTANARVESDGVIPIIVSSDSTAVAPTINSSAPTTCSTTEVVDTANNVNSDQADIIDAAIDQLDATGDQIYTTDTVTGQLDPTVHVVGDQIDTNDAATDQGDTTDTVIDQVDTTDTATTQVDITQRSVHMNIDPAESTDDNIGTADTVADSSDTINTAIGDTVGERDREEAKGEKREEKQEGAEGEREGGREDEEEGEREGGGEEEKEREREGGREEEKEGEREGGELTDDPAEETTVQNGVESSATASGEPDTHSDQEEPQTSIDHQLEDARRAREAEMKARAHSLLTGKLGSLVRSKNTRPSSAPVTKPPLPPSASVATKPPRPPVAVVPRSPQRVPLSSLAPSGGNRRDPVKREGVPVIKPYLVKKGEEKASSEAALPDRAMADIKMAYRMPGWYKEMFQGFQHSVEELFPESQSETQHSRTKSTPVDMDTYVYDHRGLKVRKSSLSSSSPVSPAHSKTHSARTGPADPVYVYDHRGLRVRKDSITSSETTEHEATPTTILDLQEVTTADVLASSRRQYSLDSGYDERGLRLREGSQGNGESAHDEGCTVFPGDETSGAVEVTKDDVIDTVKKPTAYKSDKFTTEPSRTYWSTIDQQFAEEQRKKTEAELQQEEVRVCHRDNSSGDLPSPQQRMAHMHPLLTEGLEDVPTQSASGEGSEVFERIDAQKLAGALENAKTLGTMEQEGVPSHMLPLQQQQREQSTEPEKLPPPGKKARALFPFEGQREKELSFPKGAIIDLLHTVNENWLEGMVGQTKGIFPTSYVQVLSHEELREALARESAPLMQARATYDFDPQNERELQFKKGDIIAITKKIDDNWFQGYLGDQKGIFPSSYVEILEATQ